MKKKSPNSFRQSTGNFFKPLQCISGCLNRLVCCLMELKFMDDEIENASVGEAEQGGMGGIRPTETKWTWRNIESFVVRKCWKALFPVILNVDLLWHRAAFYRDGDRRYECEHFME